MSRSVRFLVVLAILAGILVSVAPVVADTWSLAGDFSSTAQGNHGWYYRNAWGQSLGSSAALWGGTGFDTSYNMWTAVPIIKWGGSGYTGSIFYTTQATGWGKYPMSWGQIGTFPAGVVGFVTGDNNGQSTVARWVAAADGDYSYSVTFSAPPGSGDLNGVYVNSSAGRLAGELFLSATNTAYSWTGSVHLLAGNFIDFVQDTQNASNVNTKWDNYELPVTLVNAIIYNTPVDTTGTISGVIKDTNGNLLVGATVQDTSSDGQVATTGTDGAYRFQGVPIGSRTIRASKAGYSTEQITVSVVAGQTVNGDITTLATSYIRGVVSDSVNLVPIAGVVVNATGGYSAVTQGDGSYVIQVSPGTYDLSVQKTNFAPGSLTGVVVARAENKTGQNIAMTPLTGAVSGTVKDSGGNGLTGVTITDTSSGGPSTTTGIGGLYTLNGVNAGSHTLQASKPGYSTEQLAGVSVSAGLTASGQDFTLTASYITGTVTDATTHAPIVGATVQVGSQFATTASNGTYSVQVSPGTWTVTASEPSHLPGSIAGVVVAKGATVSGQNISLAVGWDFASGFTASPQNGVWSYRYSDENGAEKGMEYVNFNTDYVPSISGNAPTGGGWFCGPRFVKNVTGGAIVTSMYEDINQSGQHNVYRDAGKVISNSGYSGNCAAIARFTAPSAGVFDLVVRFAGVDLDGSTVPVAVRQNGAYIFGQFKGTAANGYTDSYGTAQVVSGFAGTAANSYADGFGAAPVVTFTQRVPLGDHETIEALVMYPGGTVRSNAVQLDMDVSVATAGTGTISGVVKSDLAGNPPIAGATVEVQGGSVPYRVATGTDGSYSVAVPSGASYDLLVQASGCDDNTSVTGLSVSENQTYTRNFTLHHGDVWNLAADYSTQVNPNNQWSYLCWDPLFHPGATMYNWGHFSWFMGGMYVWGSGPLTDINFNAGWVLKNTTGGPIGWSLDHGDGRGNIATGYVDNGQLMLGGGGGPTVRWTSPDQRIIKIDLTITDQEPTILGSDVLSCGIFRNGQLLNRKSVQGFYGSAPNYTDRMGPSPIATYHTNLLVNAGDVIDFASGYLHDANTYWGGMPGLTAIAVTAIIDRGTGNAYTSVAQMKNLPLGSVCFLTTPTAVLNDLNADHGFSDKSFFIESDDRSAGMKCIGTAELPTISVATTGKKITLTGTVVADPNVSGQKVLQIDALTSIVDGTMPKPIGIVGKTATNTMRPVNELVRVFGKVVEKVANPDSATNTNWPWLYWTVFDGSQNVKIGMIGQQGQMGTPDLVAVAVNDYISVTGIMTLDSTGNVVVMPWIESNVRDYTPAP